MSRTLNVKLVHCEQCSKQLETRLKCSICMMCYYCSATCQKAHWSEHKKVCALDKDIIAVREIFIAWGFDRNESYHKFLPLHKQYKSTNFIVSNVKLFLRSVRDLEFVEYRSETSDEVRIDAYLRKAVIKNHVFAAIYYKNPPAIFQEVAEITNEEIILSGKAVNLIPKRYVIMSVANSALFMTMVTN